ncbi:MAG: queuosine precursor transporter [Gammaproteobacteria bacterium]|nr:queuosine precursor transporter [Gammaproteobacteria bacterium]
MNKDLTQSPPREFKYLQLLSMLYITMLLASVITTMYLVEILGFTFNMGAAVIPCMYFLGDIIAEVYGYKYSRNLIWYALLCDIVFISIAVATVHLPTPAYWHQQTEFQTVLGNLDRLIVSGIIAFPASEFINVYILSKFKILLKGSYFWIRSFTSSLIGEFSLALLGSIIIFYNTLSMRQIFFLALSSFAIKLCFSFFAVVPATLLQKWLKRVEKTDVDDSNTNFNPFKLALS